MPNPISWLIKDSEGIKVSDKIILFFIKTFYLSLRIILRIVLGREKREKFYVERGIDFGIFWNKFYRFRGNSDGSTLLKFKMPKYNFEFYCRTNKDDFQVMTVREDQII